MLKHFITTNEKMNKVIKKSLQLIKEMEVVLHGYKLWVKTLLFQRYVLLCQG